MTLNDYLALFPGHFRDMPKLNALASAVLQQAIDLQAVVNEIAAHTDPQPRRGHAQHNAFPLQSRQAHLGSRIRHRHRRALRRRQRAIRR